MNHVQMRNFYRMYPLNGREDDYLELFFDQMKVEIQLIVELRLIKVYLRLIANVYLENRLDLSTKYEILVIRLIGENFTKSCKAD